MNPSIFSDIVTITKKAKDGVDGKSSYIHIKYSAVENPTESSQLTDTPSTYIGIYYDFEEESSTDPTKYKWSKLEGKDGINAGPGEDGKTTYLHIRYSNDGGTTFTENEGETVGDYIGVYTDFTKEDSTNPATYKWSKIKGDEGPKGEKGDKGETGSSNALITLYKRSATEPSSFDGGALTYTFATDTLSGNLGTWSRSISSGSNPLYAITARAYGTGETDIIDIGEWSTPAILSENGTKGENGSTVAVITLYKRGDSAPATPSKTVSFSFHTYTVTNSDGWTLGIPSGSAPCWSIYATAVSSDGVSDTIEPSEWSEPTKAVENGEKGDKGDKGDKGNNGNGISNIFNFYLASPEQSGITTDSSGWTTTVQALSPTKKYLWNYEKIEYTDTDPVNSTPCIIGVYGDKGDKGDTGPQGETGATGPQGPQGEQGVKGTDGKDGTNGKDGKGIKSSAVTFQAGSSQKDKPTGTWTSTIPETTEALPYLWTKTVITYTDDTTSEIYTVGVGLNGTHVGGRNLLYNSKGPRVVGPSNTGAPADNYKYATYVITEPVEVNAIYTFTARIEVLKGDIDTITVYSYDPPAVRRNLPLKEDGTISFTGILTNNKLPTTILVYAGIAGQTRDKSIEISEVKLEKGNIATDWTPAPEDEIKSVTTEYYLSTSATSLSGGSWSATAPTWVNGKYMWMRTVITNGYGDKTYTPSANGVCIAGAKGDSVVSELQYHLDVSASLTTSQLQALANDSWSTESTWEYGRYIYKRVKKTNLGTGAIEYTYQGRDEELENHFKSLLSFKISANRLNYPIDKRALETEKTTIKILIEETYYNPDSYSVTINGEAVTPTIANDSFTFDVPLKTGKDLYNIVVIPVKDEANITDVYGELNIVALDITEYDKFYGAVTSLTFSGITLLDGDSCFLTQNDGNNEANKIYVYQSNSWTDFNSATLSTDKRMLILSKAQKAALEFANLKGTVAAEYAYIGTLIAKYVYARKIGTEFIELKKDPDNPEKSGMIVGGDFTSEDTDGFLTNKGIYLDSTGTAKLNDAKLKNCKIDAGEINNVTVRGAITNDVLTTNLESLGAKQTIGAVDTTTPASYSPQWLKDYLKSNLPANEMYPATVASQVKDLINNTDDSFFDIENFKYSKRFTIANGVCTEEFDVFCSGKFLKADMGESNIKIWQNSEWATLSSFSPNYRNGEIAVCLLSKADQMFFVTQTTTTIYCYTNAVSLDGFFNTSDSSLPSQGYLTGIKAWNSPRGVPYFSAKIDNTLRLWRVSINALEEMTLPTGIKEIYGLNSLNLDATAGSYGELYMLYLNADDNYYIGYRPDESSATWKTFIVPSTFITSAPTARVHFTFLNNGIPVVFMYCSEFCYSFSPPKTNISIEALIEPPITPDIYFFAPIRESATAEYIIGACRENQNLSNWYFWGTSWMDGYAYSWDNVSSGALGWITNKSTSSRLRYPIKNYFYSSDGTVVMGGYGSNPSIVINLTTRNYNKDLLIFDTKYNATDIFTALNANKTVTNKGFECSTINLNLPTTFPEGCPTYRRIPTLFSVTQTYFDVSSAKVEKYTRWDSSTGKDVEVSAYEGTPDTVTTSPTSLTINSTEYANSNWYIKDKTVLDASFTPVEKQAGIDTSNINPKDDNCEIGNVKKYKTVNAVKVVGDTVEGAVWG